MGYKKVFDELHREVQRYTHDVNIIAVSKYVGADEIEKAYQDGFRDFGENRVPDLLEKANELRMRCPDIRWHFIGNIQSKRIKELMSLPELYSIHSVDNLKHLKMIGERAISPVKIFLQMNTGEEQKGGVHDILEIKSLISELNHYPYLFFEGIMCMAPLGSNIGEIENCFDQMVQHRDALGGEVRLSMGMSGDYQIALQRGANYVRIGSLIFKSKEL